MSTNFAWLLVALLIALIAFAFPRYTAVPTNTFNVGGVYKLDSWTGKVWLCEPTSILVDNKTLIAPKGCYRIKDTTIAGEASAGSI